MTIPSPSAQTVLIVGSILGSSAVAVLIQGFLTRRVTKATAKKTDAETHAMNIGGEKTIAELYREYGLQQKKDKEELEQKLEKINEQLKIITNKLDEVNKEKENLAAENLKKDGIINELRTEVDTLKQEVATLQQEVEHYKVQDSAIKQVAAVVHEGMNEIVKQTTTN